MRTLIIQNPASAQQTAAAKSTIAGRAHASGTWLQRSCSCGNRTTAGGECDACRKKNPAGLQAKLTIGEPGDTYELEADRIADRVMGMPAFVARDGAPPQIPSLAVGRTGSSDGAPASVTQAVAGPARSLEPALQEDMEQRFGFDFSRVRVHTGATAERSARDVNANAYTVGPDIVFGAGQFAPATHAGQRLIAHELTHVMQQRAGGPSTHAGSGDEGIVQRQLPRPMPRLTPRVGPTVPQLPPLPPIYPIPADRPDPQTSPNPSDDIEDRRKRRCGTYALPITIVTFDPGPKGQGKRVKASPLTLCPGNTRGSKPLQSIYETQFACIKAANESGNWLRGHLLHGKTDKTGDRHLHGPGTTSANLIIISQSLNQQMRSWLEDAALKLVWGPLPHVLWMDVWVDSYYPGLDFFADSITIEYGPFRTATGTEGSPWNRKQFVDKRKPP